MIILAYFIYGMFFFGKFQRASPQRSRYVEFESSCSEQVTRVNDITHDVMLEIIVSGFLFHSPQKSKVFLFQLKDFFDFFEEFVVTIAWNVVLINGEYI